MRDEQMRLATSRRNRPDIAAGRERDFRTVGRERRIGEVWLRCLSRSAGAKCGNKDESEDRKARSGTVDECFAHGSRPFRGFKRCKLPPHTTTFCSANQKRLA